MKLILRLCFILRIISGVRIRVNADRLIYLEISETDLGSEERGTWQSSNISKPMTENKDYSVIVPKSKSVLLGEIFVPSDYVITGVRFSKTAVSSEGQKSAIQLQVRGTEFDETNLKLIAESEKWFDSKSSMPAVKRSSVPPGMEEMTIFRNNSDIHSDLDSLTIPLLNTSNIQVEGRPTLVGMGLVCGNCDTDEEFIVPTVVAHRKLSRDANFDDFIMDFKGSIAFSRRKEILPKEEDDKEKPAGKRNSQNL